MCAAAPPCGIIISGLASGYRKVGRRLPFQRWILAYPIGSIWSATLAAESSGPCATQGTRVRLPASPAASARRDGASAVAFCLRTTGPRAKPRRPVHLHRPNALDDALRPQVGRLPL